MNREEKSCYNRAYAIANKERIAAKRKARRAGLGDQVRRCTIEGCNGVYEARGYCAQHIGRLVHGDPLAKVQTQHHGLTLEGRFLSYVKKGRECWEWIGLRNENGYGVMHVGERIILAHRVAHMLYKERYQTVSLCCIGATGHHAWRPNTFGSGQLPTTKRIWLARDAPQVIRCQESCTRTRNSLRHR